MAGWGVRAQTQKAELRLHAIGSVVLPRKVKAALNRTVDRALARIIAKTPVGLTGRTKKAWRKIKTDNGWILRNKSNVMLFLEKGTRAHGPVRAKFLFIPLTRRAAINGWRRGYVFGVDYVLAKRVRGIRKMRIVEKETTRMRKEISKELAKLNL